MSVKESPGKGRGVFAERNLKRGEIIKLSCYSPPS